MDDVAPFALLSVLRWFQCDEVKASSLDASRVVEKLVAATTKAFATVQGKRRGEHGHGGDIRGVMQQLQLMQSLASLRNRSLLALRRLVAESLHPRCQ